MSYLDIMFVILTVEPMSVKIWKQKQLEIIKV